MNPGPIFGKPTPEADRPVVFTAGIAGQVIEASEGHALGDMVSETFHFRPKPPLGTMLEVAGAMDADGNVPMSLALRYLQKTMLAEDRERFTAFLDREDVSVDIEAVGEMYTYVSAVHAGRPTKGPSGSFSGPPGSGTTSEGGPSPEDLTSPTSTPTPG